MGLRLLLFMDYIKNIIMKVVAHCACEKRLATVPKQYITAFYFCLCVYLRVHPCWERLDSLVRITYTSMLLFGATVKSHMTVNWHWHFPAGNKNRYQHNRMLSVIHIHFYKVHTRIGASVYLYLYYTDAFAAVRNNTFWLFTMKVGGGWDHLLRLLLGP